MAGPARAETPGYVLLDEDDAAWLRAYADARGIDIATALRDVLREARASIERSEAEAQLEEVAALVPGEEEALRRELDGDG